MKTTILGGIMFMVPLAFVAIVISKTFEISLLLARPLDGLIPLDRVAGVALANILAVLIILVVCYLAGLAARGGFLSRRVERLDNLLIDVMPGYAVAKGVLGGAANAEDLADLVTPVIVAFDDYEQIAFEIERTAEQATVFLPGSPSAWTGSTIVVETRRVRVLGLPPHQTIKLLRVMGRGSLNVPAVRVEQAGSA